MASNHIYQTPTAVPGTPVFQCGWQSNPNQTTTQSSTWQTGWSCQQGESEEWGQWERGMSSISAANSFWETFSILSSYPTRSASLLRWWNILQRCRMSSSLQKTSNWHRLSEELYLKRICTKALSTNIWSIKWLSWIPSGSLNIFDIFKPKWLKFCLHQAQVHIVDVLSDP